jgi:prolyl oligopeptidase
MGTVSEDLSFYQQIYFHKLGTPVEQDTYELGTSSPHRGNAAQSRWTLSAGLVANGDGGEMLTICASLGRLRQITRFTDQIKQVEFG